MILSLLKSAVSLCASVSPSFLQYLVKLSSGMRGAAECNRYAEQEDAHETPRTGNRRPMILSHQPAWTCHESWGQS